MLIRNWRKTFKSYTVVLSVIFAMANLVMGGLFLLTPLMDAKTLAAVNFVLYCVVGIGRMVKQGTLEYVPEISRYTPMPYAQTKEEEVKYNQYDNPDL